MNSLVSMFNAAVLAGTPLLLGATGEILTEKSGQSNLGVEGMMFMGAAASVASAYYYEQGVLALGGVPIGWVAALLALASGFLAGALGALFYGFLTISLRTNQTVTGLALTIFGAGLGNFLGELMGIATGTGFVAVGNTTKAAFSGFSLPGWGGKSAAVQYLETLFISYNWVVYFAIFAALAVAFFLNRTRRGLNLRAVGENPAAADAAGINVNRYKYTATLVGGGLAGIGGMYISMVTCAGVWVNNCISGRGWLAVALVIFATWSPLRALYAALIFGGLSIIRMYLPIAWLPMQIYDMAPYIATLLVLIFTGARQLKESAQPKGCGLNYFREER